MADLEKAIEEVEALVTTYADNTQYDAFRLILAANRKMRESLGEMLVIAALYLSSGDKTARRLKDAEFGPAMAHARSALSTKED